MIGRLRDITDIFKHPEHKTPPSGFAYGALARVLARRLGHPAEFNAFIAEDAKRNLLAQVAERFGREGLIAAGREVAAESAHPFVRALRAQSTPMQVLRVWMQLEVLAHAHNRVRVLDLRDDALWLLRTRLGAPDARPLVEEEPAHLGCVARFP